MVNNLFALKVDCQTLCEKSRIDNIIEGDVQRYCTFCGSIANVEHIDHYLFCDVESSEKKTDIQKLPLDIAYKHQKFVLTGVISF